MGTALAQAYLWAYTPTTHEHRHRADDSECLPFLGYPHILASHVGSTRKQGPCLKVCLPMDPSAGVGSEDSVGLLSSAVSLALSGLPAVLPGLSWVSPWRWVGRWHKTSILYPLLCFWSSPHCCLGHSRHLCTDTFPLCRSIEIYREAMHPGWESLYSEPLSLTHHCRHGHGSHPQHLPTSCTPGCYPVLDVPFPDS